MGRRGKAVSPAAQELWEKRLKRLPESLQQMNKMFLLLCEQYQQMGFQLRSLGECMTVLEQEARDRALLQVPSNQGVVAPNLRLILPDGSPAGEPQPEEPQETKDAQSSDGGQPQS